MGSVYANQAMVTAADLTASNGIVHAVNSVILPNETVVDVAIDNGFTSLTAAVITAELLPALTNPFASLTVFAPTDAAFDQLATDLNTDLNGVLASPNLTEILLYHVVDGTVLSSQLTNGSVPTLNGQTVEVDLTNGTMINSSNVILADVNAQNGVVHAIDKVMLPSLANLEESGSINLRVYPNPTTESLIFNDFTTGEYQIFNTSGTLVSAGNMSNGTINVSQLNEGQFFLRMNTENGISQAKFVKSNK